MNIARTRLNSTVLYVIGYIRNILYSMRVGVILQKKNYVDLKSLYDVVRSIGFSYFFFHYYNYYTFYFFFSKRFLILFIE